MQADESMAGTFDEYMPVAHAVHVEALGFGW
jgi:hypothetical protein